ncbi:hypothetical protein HK098_005098 [Nowakowskiella sp. JEL0407]|nr:hypothetical protein HK098_005098 [Nowakowskiella sp. JEL0407]
MYRISHHIKSQFFVESSSDDSELSSFELEPFTPEPPRRYLRLKPISTRVLLRNFAKRIVPIESKVTLKSQHVNNQTYLKRLTRTIKNVYFQSPDSSRTSGFSDSDSREKTQNIDPSVEEEKLKEFDTLFNTIFMGNLEKLKRLDRASGKYLDERDLRDWLVQHDHNRCDEYQGYRCYLHRRGAHGLVFYSYFLETILHKLCLYIITTDDPVQIQEYDGMIRYLLNSEYHRRFLINAIYEGPVYRGEHAAHFLCVRRREIDLRLLKYLIERGADVHLPRAAGIFFGRDSAQYCGGSLLGMCVRLGNRRVLNYLLGESVRMCPDIIDTWGNTALHTLAWFGITAWDQEAIASEPNPDFRQESPFVTLRREGANVQLLNRQEYTPFLLAMARKQSDVARQIIEELKETDWVFGDVGAYRYPLNRIDVNNNEKRKHGLSKWTLFFTFQWKEFFKKLWNGDSSHASTALELAVKNQDNAALENISILRIVLEAKWYLYAKDMFYFYFTMSLLYQLIFLTVQAITPFGPVDELVVADGKLLFPNATRSLGEKRLDYFSSSVGIARLVLESYLVLANFATVIQEFLEMNRAGLRMYFFSGFNVHYNLLQWLSISVFVVGVVFRFLYMPVYETFMASVLSVTGWFQLLYFAKGMMGIGPLVIMVYKMIVDDFGKRFLPLYAVILIAFSQAVWLQMAFFSRNDDNFSVDQIKADVQERPTFNDATGTNQTFPFADAEKYWRNLLSTILHIFGQLVGGSEFDNLEKSPIGLFSILLFVIYGIITVLLLLNVLIAMFNTTYTSIIEKATQVWQIEWANVILEMDYKMARGRLESYPFGIMGPHGERFIRLQFKAGERLPTMVIVSDNANDDFGATLLRRSKKRFADAAQIMLEDTADTTFEEIRSRGGDR